MFEHVRQTWRINLFVLALMKCASDMCVYLVHGNFDVSSLSNHFLIKVTWFKQSEHSLNVCKSSRFSIKANGVWTFNYLVSAFYSEKSIQKSCEELSRLSTMANCSSDQNSTVNCNISIFCSYDPSLQLQVPKNLYYTYIVTSAFNAVFSLTAFLGNALVLTALVRTRSLHSPSKALLRSLALSDLCVGLLVQPVYIAYCVAGIVGNQWVRCASWTVYPLLSDYFVAVSFFTMIAISIDRFLALRLRASYRSVVTITKANITVLSLWLTSLIFPIGRLLAGKVAILFSVVSFVLFVVIPTLTHLKINRMLHHQGRQVSNQFYLHREESYLSINKYKKSVFAMRFIYIALLLCYIPITCVAVLYIFIKDDSSVKLYLLPVGNFATTLLFFNSSMNPVLYCWRIRQVRGAMWNLVNNFHPCPCC